MKKQILLSILSFLICTISIAVNDPKLPKTKTVIVSGKIIDSKNNEYLAGVKIESSFCKKTIYSDLEGRFFMYLETSDVELLTIQFSQIGYDAKTLHYKDFQSQSANLYINLTSK